MSWNFGNELSKFANQPGLVQHAHKHMGNAAQRWLVVRGMAIVVVENWETRSFWKMITGRMPDCSEPWVGLRAASQTSPRLSELVMVSLLDRALRHSRSCLLRQGHGLHRQTP
jgi:hypothetical protein